VPAEQRREQRRAALLDAALEIIGTRGFAKLTVAGLCAQAGLNERYYYEGFSTLEEVFTEVFDRIVTELRDAILEALGSAPADTFGKIRASVAAGVDVFADDPRKSRLVFVEALAHPAVSARRAEIMRSFASLVVLAGQEHFGPEIASQVGDRAHFAALHLVGGLYETVTGWLAGDLRITRDELVDRSADLFLLVGRHLVGDAFPF
jgi:AcrR family transcriptional regulator